MSSNSERLTRNGFDNASASSWNGRCVTTLTDLEQAVSSYMSRAAEKLRQQHSMAGAVHVYIRTNPNQTCEPQYCRGITLPLRSPTADTITLVRTALHALIKIYRTGYRYQKAGVELHDITPANWMQDDLFSTPLRPLPRRHNLMDVMDSINARYGNRSLYLASEGTHQTWQMKRGNRSPNYTTRWDELAYVQG